MSARNSDGTRGTFSGGGRSLPEMLHDIEYITIASSGNTIDFGDLTQGKDHTGSASSSTRGLIMVDIQVHLNILILLTILK